MHCEINVSRFGSHLFATHERSLTSESEAQACYALFMVKFPENEGFQVTVSKREVISNPVTWAPRTNAYKTPVQIRQDRQVCDMMERGECSADTARAYLEAEEWSTPDALASLRGDRKAGLLRP